MQNNIVCIHFLSWLYHCNVHYKDVVKHSNVGHNFIYVLLTLSPCVLILKYLHVAGLDLGLEDLVSASTSWFLPRPQSFGLSLSLGLNILASFNITGCSCSQILSDPPKSHVICGHVNPGIKQCTTLNVVLMACILY